LAAFTADFARSASDGENRPITSREWQDYDASIEVAADAKTIYLVLGLKGGGKAWFDAITLQPVDGAKSSGTVSVGAGAGAETFSFSGRPGNAPEGWDLAKSPQSANFRVDRATGCSGGDAACLVLSGEAAERKTTLPARVFEADLGGGVSCIVPLALYADAEGTLPRDAVQAETGLRPERPAGWQPSGNDRSTRLAAVAVAWNALQHFYRTSMSWKPTGRAPSAARSRRPPPTQTTRPSSGRCDGWSPSSTTGTATSTTRATLVSPACPSSGIGSRTVSS
jgi:hypothetical protein